MSLLETMLSLTLAASVAAAVSHQIATATILVHAYQQTQKRLLVSRQTEHLIASALAAARESPPGGDVVNEFTSANIEILSDLDGDGGLDAGSAETTAVSLEPGINGVRLRHRIGAQKMTITEGLPPQSRFSAFDSGGMPTARTRDIALVSIPVGQPPSTYFTVAPPP